MNKFNDIVAGALDLAQTECLKRKNLELHPLHLVWGLVAHPDSFLSRQYSEQKKEIQKLLDQLPTSQQQPKELRTHSDLSKWLTFASSHAIQRGQKEIAEQDLLKNMAEILPELPFNYEKMSEIEEQTDQPDFLINLNELAEEGKLDPVIGRGQEIRAVMEILGRRGKNNPVLVGPAGVGKTAIVEGLALAIHKGQVPDILKNKTVYSLEMGALVAGTKFRGEFEERLQGLLKFIKEKSGQAILFIDEIHQLVGAGKTEGAMDAANLLKPALARGELFCIGATTPNEYQKYILNDSALDRRFRAVSVNEPSHEEAIEIMMGLREKLEIHHGIKISDEAIFESVFLSDQYMTDKQLPDKAIDIIDEAASAMKLSAESMPVKLEELQREIRAKEIQMQYEKTKVDEVEVKNLRETFQKQKEEWDQEVLALKQVSEVKSELDRLKFKLEQAELKQDYEEASKLKYSLIPEQEERLKQFEHNWVLSKQDVAQIISRHTGIPVEKILKSKQDNILELENFLEQRIFGQDESLHEVSETLMASYAGLSDPSRPLGSFLLLGPSGVGKTETAKGLTQFLFNSEKNLIRFDLSEFSEKHSVAKLIGAPAGYIGHDEGGVLTEAVRRKPYAVILFDEIEKAHSDFSDILLQILDDARLTDNKGRTIDFKNTIILLTSNSKNIEQDFKPEVLGRLDNILEYKSLGAEVVEKLIEKQLTLLNQRLEDKNLKVEVDEATKEVLKAQGYHEKFGARPLQALFQKIVSRPLSKKILSGSLKEGSVKGVYNSQTHSVNFE